MHTRILKLTLVLALSLLFIASSHAQKQDSPKDTPTPDKERPASKSEVPDWGAVQNVNRRGIFQNLSPESKEKPNEKVSRQLSEIIARANALNIPALAPLNLSDAEKVRMVTRRDNLYTFKAYYPDGKRALVLGSCAGEAPPEGYRRKASDSTDPSSDLQPNTWITRSGRSEVGYEIGFSVFNCAYEITASCEENCNEEALARNVFNSLGLLNDR